MKDGSQSSAVSIYTNVNDHRLFSGLVVQKPISSQVNEKVQVKLPNNLFIKFEIFSQKSFFDQSTVHVLKF